MANIVDFNIGDIIVAIGDSAYSITTKSNGFVGKVIDVDKSSRSDIRVEVLETKDSYYIGGKHWVQSKYFEHKEKSAETTIQSIANGFKREKEALLDAVKTYEENTSKLEHKFEDAVLKLKEEQLEAKLAPKARKTLINQAIAFVEKNKEVSTKGYRVDVDFVVNTEKRTVVAIGRGIRTKIVHNKAIAKCNPNDVFNANIGKAIALGRLMGKDITEFTSVPNPEDFAVGQIIEGGTEYYPEEIHKNRTCYGAEGNKVFTSEGKSGWLHRPVTKILSDTNAQY